MNEFLSSDLRHLITWVFPIHLWMGNRTGGPQYQDSVDFFPNGTLVAEPPALHPLAQNYSLPLQLPILLWLISIHWNHRSREPCLLGDSLTSYGSLWTAVT